MDSSPQYLDRAVAARYPVLSRISAFFRRRRAKEFIERMGVTADTRILDVGGEPYFWQHFPVRCPVHCINIHEMASPDPRITVQAFPGGTLPFEDKSFDIVFSNSVIEHVGDFRTQRAFASECVRVGKRYWVQTPNFFFPWEPHAHFPGFQFLPGNLKLAVVRNWKRAGYGVDEMLSIRLLTTAELKLMFPEAQIFRERFLGVTKSMSAYH